jgi:phosphatidylglycerophosphate synthase
MRIAAKDVLAPANAITLIGFILVVVGVFKMNTTAGLSMVAAGRFLDTLDGPIARRTHSSRLGAVLDASSDKLTILAMMLACYYFHLAPLAFIIFIFAQNLVTSLIFLASELRHRQMTASKAGKRTMFLFVTALLLYSLSHLYSGTAAHAISWVAAVIATFSVLLAAKATYGYTQQLHSNSNPTS